MKMLKIIAKTSLTLLLAALIFSHVQVWAAKEKEAELFLVAQKAFDDGFYDVAIRYIEQLLSQYPQTEKRVQAKLLLGQCYFFKEQYLKAFDIFHGLLEFNEYKDATFFWLAETYHKGSDYKQAEEYYQQVIDLYPNSIYASQSYYSIAWTYFLQENYEKSKKAFIDFIERFPNHELIEDAAFKIGECEYNSGEYKNAIDSFRDYVQKFPESKRHDQAYFYIGEAYYYLEDFKESIKYYSKTIDITSDDKLLLLSNVSIGWGYLKLEDPDNAKKYLDTAYEISKKTGILSDDIHLGRASLFFSQKNYQEALSEYNMLISSFPDSPRIAEAYLGKANCLYLLSNYENAITQYKSIIEKFSNKNQYTHIIEKAYFGLAWTHLKSGQPEKAIKNFQSVIKNTNNDITKVSALTQIGDAYQDLGRLIKAIEAYDKILEEFPNSMYADYIQYRQAIALLKLDKIEAATISFQSLQSNFPDSKYLDDINYYLGLAYFKKGEWVSAKDQIEKFINKVPKTHTLQPEANYILGLSIYNLKKPEESLRVFKRIVKNYPDRTSIVRDSEINIAKCLYSLNDDKEALKKFKIIVYKYPETQTALESLMWLGDYYSSVQKFEKARDFYKRAVDEFPGNDEIDRARLKLGKTYEALGEFDNALNQYKNIEDKSDREIFAKAKLAIADIFSKNIEPKEAIKRYLEITESSPEFTRDAYVKVALIKYNQRKFKEAIEYYEKARFSDVGLSSFTNAELQFYIAEIYETMNMWDRAIEEYLKIPYIHKNEKRWAIKAYLRAARIFEYEEKWNDAILVYEKILDYDSGESKFAQERIEWIKTNIGFNKE